MTTEVQIYNNSIHLPYVKRIFEKIASSINIGKNEIGAAEKFLSEACFQKSNNYNNNDGFLTVKFNIADDCLMIEILDSICKNNEFSTELDNEPENIESEKHNVVYFKTANRKLIRIQNTNNKNIGIYNRQKQILSPVTS